MDPFQNFLIEALHRRQIQMMLLEALQRADEDSSNNYHQANQKIFLADEEEVVTKQQYQKYQPEIKDLYNSLFTTDEQNEQKISLKATLNFPQRKTEIPACTNYSYKEKIKFYHCYDCEIETKEDGPNRIFCQECFESGDHRGHRYQIKTCSGKCDCGSITNGFRGTCNKHSGIIPKVEINQEQARIFFSKMQAIFHWIFKLFQSKNQLNEETQYLAVGVCHYLMHLNEDSVYYNYLTSDLFFQTQMNNGESLIIQKLFKYGLKNQDYVEQVIKIIFSLQFIIQHKCKLAIEFTKAYNTLEGFQSSQYNKLFSQLLSDEQVLKYCAEQKIVLKPQKIIYKPAEYYLKLYTTIDVQNKGAVEYINALLQQGQIQLKFLQELYKKNLTNNQSMEKILTKANVMEEEVYYLMVIQMLKSCKYDHQIAKKMLINLFHQLQSFKYEFNQNCMVYPYERLFMLSIFVFFNGNLSNVRIDKLLQVLNLADERQVLMNILKNKILKKTLSSLSQYAKTLISQELANCSFQYFKGAASSKIIDMDILSFKICICLLSQQQNQGLNVVKNIFQVIFQEFQEEDLLPHSSILDIFVSVVKNKKKKFQYSNIQNTVLRLILESVISTKSQLYLKNHIMTQQSETIDQNITFWQKFCLNFNSFEEPMFKELKSYIFHFDIRKKEYLASTLMFNDQTSKFTVDPAFTKTISSAQRYPIQNIPTIKKVFSNVKGFIQQKEKAKLLFIEQSSFQSKLGHILFSKQSLEYLIYEKTKYYQNSMNFASQEIDAKQKLQFQNFFQIMMEINQAIFDGLEPSINSFFIEIKQNSKKVKYSFMSKFFPQKQKPEQNLNKQKMNQKKSKRMKEFKQKQNSFSLSEDDAAVVQEEELQCIVCREKSLDNFNNLCYLADFRHSNIIQSFTQTKGSFLTFNSCFHCIHMSCFTKLVKDKTFVQCPLCRKKSNIILPIQKELLTGKPISLYIMERIESQRKVQQLSSQNYSQAEREIFLYTINSLVYKCCLNLAQMGRYLKEKQIKLMKILYLFAKNLHNSSKLSQKLSIEKCSNEYLEDLHQLQILMRKKPYPGYALFSILFKLFYLNIIDQQVQKDQIQEQYKTIIDQNQIQHCWRIVHKIIESSQKMEVQNVEIYSNYSKKVKKQVQRQSSIKTLLKSLFVFYDPPKKIDDMLKIRDTCQSTCAKQHQELICIICQWKGCYNCKKAKQHIKLKHLGEGILFNDCTGQILCYLRLIPYLTIIPSLYQNRLGTVWTPSKKPQTYELDIKLYNKIVNYFLNNQLQTYITRKEKSMKFRTE